MMQTTCLYLTSTFVLFLSSAGPCNNCLVYVEIYIKKKKKKMYMFVYVAMNKKNEKNVYVYLANIQNLFLHFLCKEHQYFLRFYIQQGP